METEINNDLKQYKQILRGNFEDLVAVRSNLIQVFLSSTFTGSYRI